MRLVAGSIALILITIPSRAFAQSDEQRANARALANQGAQAFSEARWQEAIDLFDRAESLLDAPTHLLFSARAHAELRHYVKARELYLRIVRMQLAPDAPHAFRDAQASANQELNDVAPHIAQLTIVLRGPDPKVARVTLDGAPVQSVLIGVGRPIDPGAHRVRAEAAGFNAQSTQVSVPDGGKANVTLELSPSEAPAPAPIAAPVAPRQSPAGPGTPNDVARAPASNAKKVASYAAFGVGAAGLAAGAVFLANSLSKRAQADKKFQDCGGATGCANDNPLSGQVSSLDDSARSARTLSVVGFGLGAAGIGAGVALFLLGNQHAKPAIGFSLQPELGVGSVGVSGTF